MPQNLPVNARLMHVDLDRSTVTNGHAVTSDKSLCPGMQNDLETVFLSADKSANKGKESGSLKKADATVLLKAYFAVGEPGGKTLERFDTLMQAMETDQPGPTIEHRKVFEEDREFNQGGSS